MPAGKPGAELQVFDDLTQFSKAVEAAGFAFDFQSLTKLNINFFEPSDKYLILNIKDYGDDPNNLLFLNEDKTFLYSKAPPPQKAFETFEKVYSKPYGKSTVLAFLTLNKALTSYKKKLETLINSMRELEQNFDAKRYRELTFEYAGLYDRVEDFNDIVIRLEESGIKEVETRLISFDYSVLIAESTSLLDRCRNRLNILKDIARDHEMQTAAEFNKRLERLNVLIMKLTALTIIFMTPNIIAGHFGMNFAYMPELRVPWVYPAVIASQIAIVLTLIVVFRRVKWL